MNDKNSSRVNLFFWSLGVSVVFLISLFPCGYDWRSFAVSLDPSLGVHPAETLWGVLSHPVVTGLGWFGFPAGISIPTVAVAVLTAGFMAQGVLNRTLPRGEWFVGVVIFPAMAWIEKRFSAKPLSLWDLFVVSLFLSLYSGGSTGRRKDSGIPVFTKKVCSFGVGTVSAFGILYFFLVLPVWTRLQNQPNHEPSSLRKDRLPLFFALGFLSVSLCFQLVRLRYPNPWVPPIQSVLPEWLDVWLYGETVLVRSFPEGTAGAFGRFPGVGLLVAWMVGRYLGKGVQRIWDLAAGRTVPVQVALLSGPLLCFAGMIGVWAQGVSENTPWAKHREATAYARTLLKMLPPRTTMVAAPPLFGRVSYLATAEGCPTSFHFLPGDRNAWKKIVDSANSTFGRTERHPIAYAEGTNWLEIAGERVVFHPHYLLSATLEVYEATPSFFVGNDPVSATGGAVLRYEGRVFEPETAARLDILDWGYNGERFLIYRDHRRAPWKPLEGRWSVDYLGFLLKEDVERSGNRCPGKRNRPIRDYYRD